MMAKDAKGIELKRGDRVAVQATVEHAHDELVTLRFDTVPGQFEPQLTFHPGKVVRLSDEEPQSSEEEKKA